MSRGPRRTSRDTSHSDGPVDLVSPGGPCHPRDARPGCSPEEVDPEGVPTVGEPRVPLRRVGVLLHDDPMEEGARPVGQYHGERLTVPVGPSSHGPVRTRRGRPYGARDRGRRATRSKTPTTHGPEGVRPGRPVGRSTTAELRHGPPLPSGCVRGLVVPMRHFCWSKITRQTNLSLFVSGLESGGRLWSVALLNEVVRLTGPRHRRPQD